MKACLEGFDKPVSMPAAASPPANSSGHRPRTQLPCGWALRILWDRKELLGEEAVDLCFPLIEHLIKYYIYKYKYIYKYTSICGYFRQILLSDCKCCNPHLISHPPVQAPALAGFPG